jgi:hypothetical protein
MTRAKAQRAPRFGEISKSLTLRAWRPFGKAQDMLGAINFLKGVLLNISKVKNYSPIIFTNTRLRRRPSNSP